MYTKLCRSGPGYFYLRWFGLHATELSTPSSTLYNTAQKGVRDCHVEQIHSRQPSSSLRSEETNESHSQQDDPIRGTKIITTFPVFYREETAEGKDSRELLQETEGVRLPLYGSPMDLCGHCLQRS